MFLVSGMSQHDEQFNRAVDHVGWRRTITIGDRSVEISRRTTLALSAIHCCAFSPAGVVAVPRLFARRHLRIQLLGFVDACAHARGRRHGTDLLFSWD